jgi:N-acetylmuramoyl-L-alanine amidase
MPRALDPRREELADDRYRELAAYSGTRTRAEVETALALIDPRGLLRPYLVLHPDAADVHLAPGTPAVKIAFAPASTATPPPLRRIALDPGHSGGAWSELESRHIVQAGGAPVREGDLTWATGRIIERRLRAAGRDVQLLRGPPPTATTVPEANSGFDLPTELGLWLAENDKRDRRWLSPYTWWRLRRQAAEASETRLFELYTHYELRRRAAAAAAFGSDVTLSLHYNACHGDANGVLAFVHGNVLPGELATASQRFWALRRVFDGTLPEATALARRLLAALMHHFDLPALPHESLSPSERRWWPVAPEIGLYARNLAVLRRTPGLAILVEGPCVNQPEEYARLQQADVEVDGRRYPSRVQQYADGVLEALLHKIDR